MIKRATLVRTLLFKALIFCALLSCNTLRAQYVSIPDSGFNAYLQAAYPSCFNNGQLDTTCTLIVTAPVLNVSYKHIASLEGAQYFKSLDSLNCNSDTTLVYLPALAKTLRVLECRNDSLTSLPALPDSLIRLACEFNVLNSLPTLPATLNSLTCYNNQLTSLPALPGALRALYCSGNQIATLPALPDSLTILSCYSNKLTVLPTLSALTGLVDLLCSNNQLDSLPALPLSLRDLSCYANTLTRLPALPDSLQFLSCGHNQLAILPALPNSLTLINCEYNQLTSLPALPDSLFQLFIDNNPNLKCLPQLNTIVDFEYFTTGVVCLPNAGNIYYSNPDTIQPCNSANNTYGCLEINAIKEIAKPAFNLYPNPSKDFVMLSVQQNTPGEVMRIMNSVGQVLITPELKTPNTTFSTANFAPGLYMVLVSDRQGQTAVSKLVIQ